MTLKYTNIHRVFFLTIDLILLNSLFLIPIFFFQKEHNSDLRDLIIVNLIANIAWLFSSYVLAVYVIYKQVNLKILVKRTAICYLLFAAGILLLIIFSNLVSYSIVTVGIIVSFGIIILLSRLILVAYVLYTRSNIKFIKKVIIIGYNETAQALIGSFSSSQSNIRCIGCFDNIDLNNVKSNFKDFGKIQDSIEFAKKNDVREIYCTLSPEKYSYLYKLAETAEKQFIRFRFVPAIHEFINRKVHLDFVDDMPILSLRSEPMNYSTAQLKKRVFDILISLTIILLILTWLIPILAVIIKLDSKGPVFFRQLRGGINNRKFFCIKLRTLKISQSVNDEAVQVKKRDSRTTKVGRFLRKTNLDELPQFFNVLIGDMSVVGARPHMLQHDISFADLETRYIIRFLSKPGVTGWAQINGLRGEIKETIQLTSRIEHDIWYIENWNTWLDIKIVWLTVQKTIMGDKNAY